MAFYKITGENKNVFDGGHFDRGPRFYPEGDYFIAEHDPEYRRFEKAGKFPDMPHRLRVCDDDGVTYFWGVCSDDSSFAPLEGDGYAYGCTYIEYKDPKTGKYEML